MENASKALLMAGSVLIAILILGLLVLLFQSIGIIPQSTDEQKAAEQLAKFNAQWESYNKKAMYGTDVITVINKAIENNNKYLNYGKEEFNEFRINIKFSLLENEPLQQTKYIFQNGKRINTETENNNEFKKTGKANYYSLVIDSSYDADKVNDSIINLMNASQVTYSKNYKKGDLDYEVTYSSFSDFKRRYFKCVKIDYKENGTVDTLYFQQWSSAEY